MKNFKLKLAVLSALSLASVQALATGLVAIPATGFVAPAPVSAYTLCNTTGNFGSSTITNPTAGANNTCAVFPTNEATAPKPGYAVLPAKSTTRSVFSGAVNVGSVLDNVWRKPAATAPATATDMCIFGTRFTAINALVGTKYFEVNDIARGGFSASGTVNAGYFIQAANASPAFRIGRSFTSVQHRALKYDTAANKLLVGTNYVALPTVGGISTLNINGENVAINSTTAATTIAANQTAAINSNWVDFTLDSTFADDDGGTNAVSAMTYVEAPCNNTTIDATWEKAGAIRLRQTAQENTTFSELNVTGYAPPGAVVP